MTFIAVFSSIEEAQERANSRIRMANILVKLTPLAVFRSSNLIIESGMSLFPYAEEQVLARYRLEAQSITAQNRELENRLATTAQNNVNSDATSTIENQQPASMWKNCIICSSILNTSDEDSIFLSCGHVYHRWCVRRWLKHAAICPTCRSDETFMKKYLFRYIRDSYAPLPRTKRFLFSIVSFSIFIIENSFFFKKHFQIILRCFDLGNSPMSNARIIIFRCFKNVVDRPPPPMTSTISTRHCTKLSRTAY